MWLNDFTQVFRELLSNRYPEWKADGESYALGVRFYASIGDINNALDIYKSFPEIDNKIAIRDIMLSLVYKNRALEALEFKEKFTHKSIQEEQALIAVYLALNDKEKP